MDQFSSTEIAVPEALKQVGDEVAGLAARVTAVDGVVAGETISAAQTLINQLESLKLAAVSLVERSGIWRDEPNASMASWLRAHSNLDHRQARADVCAARALQALPVLAGAAAAGLVRRGAVDVIVSIGTANAMRARVLAEFDEPFTTVASTQSVGTVNRVLRAWADQIDPLATVRDESSAHERRFLQVSQVADGYNLSGFFTSEQGMKLVAVLNAALNKRFRASANTATTSNTASMLNTALTESSEALVVVRASEKDRADVFIDDVIGSAAASGGLGETGGVKPSVCVTVPMARLEEPCHQPVTAEQLQAQAEQLAAGQLPFLDGVATVSSSSGPGQALISARAAQRLTCDCEISRIVLNPAGVPIDVGRATRTIPLGLRKLLNIRDGGCAFPFCDRPTAWCEAHHVIHWANGGKTSPENTVLLCSRHHHDVHSKGHRISFDSDGRPRFKLK